MKKIVIIFLFGVIIVGGVVFGTNFASRAKRSTPQGSTSQVSRSVAGITSATSPIPQVVRPGVPVRLRIPAIGVDTNVEQVGLDRQGRMEVPSTSETVGWYDLGFRPGENGNAAIDGHLDKVTGAPAVFWNLHKLQKGDKIVVSDTNGKSYTFSVTQTANYPYNQFPLQEVFGTAQSSRLNLITCEGVWDALKKNYSHRTVVYSTLVK